jgi:hypothetical protein
MGKKIPFAMPIKEFLAINAMFKVCMLNRFENSNKGEYYLARHTNEACYIYCCPTSLT